MAVSHRGARRDPLRRSQSGEAGARERERARAVSAYLVTGYFFPLETLSFFFRGRLLLLYRDATRCASFFLLSSCTGMSDGSGWRAFFLIVACLYGNARLSSFF
nr:hypothetical protein [Pandoravirus belohorizontensis]